jgi:hypothetical protein
MSKKREQLRRKISEMAYMFILSYPDAEKLKLAVDTRAMALTKKVMKGYQEKLPYYGFERGLR